MKSLPDAVEEYCEQRNCGALVIEVRKISKGFDAQQASDSGPLAEQCSSGQVLNAMIVSLEATLEYYRDLQRASGPVPTRTENHRDYRFAFLDGEILVHAALANELSSEELAHRLEFMANKVRTEAPLQPPRH